MKTKVEICSLPACDNIVGLMPFRLGGHNYNFCSRECVNDAFDLKKKGKEWHKAEPRIIEVTKKIQINLEKESVEIKAAEFGDASIIRRFCDNSRCQNPRKNPVYEKDGRKLTMITISWRGRNGEYCSKECRDSEKDKSTMTTEENDSPIAAGTSDSKKSGKKTATKKSAKSAKSAKAGKESKPAKEKKSRSGFADDAVITVKKESELKGKRGDAMNAMKSGMTVAKYREALEKKDLSGYAGWALRSAAASGNITIK